jgi:hypothetical protein
VTLARRRIARVLGLTLGWVALSSFAATADQPSPDCSYYAAPAKTGGGTISDDGKWGSAFSWSNAFDSPGTLMGFFDVASPGDVLCLRSGTYRGPLSMPLPPVGFGGKPGKPIEVRALVDGAVWIDGEHKYGTASIAGAHWVISGFTVYNAKRAVLAINGQRAPAHDVVVRRVVAYRDPIRTLEDTMNVDVVLAQDVLLEDVACFGTARKCVQVYRSSRVTTCRVWARWDGRWPNQNGNQFAFTAMYRSFDSLAENVLATSGGVDETGYTPDDYSARAWLIGTDRGPKDEDVTRWAAGRDSHDIRLRTLGSIAYDKPGQRHMSHGVLMTRAGMKGSVLQDVAVSLPATAERLMITHDCLDNDSHCVWRPGDKPNRATRVTLIGGLPNTKTKWKLGQFEASAIQRFDVPQPVDIFTPEAGGATVCHRYVDAKLTRDPLWPWPMNARILEATRKSGWGEANVTADIEAIFGTIPAQCRANRAGL